MSKHIRISNNGCMHLDVIKKQHWDNPRFSYGDALDELIKDKETLKKQVEWLMNKK